jgi:probable rRNA maturation factor
MPKPRVQFSSELKDFKLLHPRRTANWLKTIAIREQRALDNLTYIFCSDDFLLSLNKEFLRHSTYTDILSFDYSETDAIAGEIFISIHRVRENAEKFDQEFEVELRRVMAHGLLHFLGYKDKSPRQKAQMRRKEEACLSLWK